MKKFSVSKVLSKFWQNKVEAGELLAAMYRRNSKYSKNKHKKFFLFRPLHIVFIYRRLMIIVLIPTYNIT